MTAVEWLRLRPFSASGCRPIYDNGSGNTRNVFEDDELKDLRHFRVRPDHGGGSPGRHVSSTFVITHRGNTARSLGRAVDHRLADHPLFDSHMVAIVRYSPDQDGATQALLVAVRQSRHQQAFW
jgi:hypothetical protein